MPGSSVLSSASATGRFRRPFRRDLHGHEPARRVGGIKEGLASDAGDPHRRLVALGVIDEGEVTDLHGLEVERGLVVAHAVPDGRSVPC